MNADDLRALRLCLRGSVERAKALLNSDRDVDAPGTAAGIELGEQHEFAGSWGSDPIELAYGMAGGLLCAADDYLLSFDLTLDRSMPFTFTPYVIARSALETCARAAWLLEPGLGTRQRIARFMNEALYSLREEGAMPEGMKDETQRNINVITKVATERGFAVSQKGEQVWLDDEPRPGATRLASDFVGGLEGIPLGRLAYKFWSALSHGTYYALTEILGPDGTPNRIPIDTQVTMTVVVLYAYLKARGLQFECFGWEERTWTIWVNHVHLTAARAAFVADIR